MVRPSNANPPTPSSSARSLHSTVHDAASVARGRLHDVVSHIQKPETRTTLRDSWDSLVKVVFAPCAGDIGGVARDDLGGGSTPPDTPPRSKGASAPSWGASVPFEVSASQDKSTSFQASSFATQRTQEGGEYPMQRLNPAAQRGVQTPRERCEARSRAKLRVLGARHQLASGLKDESLADALRPVSPKETEEEIAAASPDLVDFDDGISAISAHTLEEMEQRWQAKERKNVLRLSPKDFTQIIDENAELNCTADHLQGVAVLEDENGSKNTEVVFGEPFYDEGLFKDAHAVDDWHGNQHLEFSPGSDIHRVRSGKSQKTKDTTITEESNEFEEMYLRQEAMYWTDQDQVAHTETNAMSSRCRPSQRVSIEERARRLRELSRSRSRSDGTGSNKSGSSSLVSGQHPHDTVPVFSSDLFPRRKKSNSNRSRRSQAPESRISTRAASDGNNPFSSLDYGEI